MSRIERYAPGQFCWVDLMSTDGAASRRFYGELFGWTCSAVGEEEGGAYHHFYLGERAVGGPNVAGMGEMDEAMKQSGMPPVWTSYVNVEDIDAATARAVELGASIAMPRHSIEVGGEHVGTMAIFCDPEGAMLSLWQAGAHRGAELVNEPGSFAWNELTTRDLSAAKRFYGELFGWTFREDENYCEISNGERSNGGMLPIQPAMGDTPANWGVYFSVKDCDAAIEQIEKLGGEALMTPIDIEPGRLCPVRDSEGAYFNVIALHHPE